MKSLKKILLYNALLFTIALIWTSCKDEEKEQLNLSRRFKPALFNITAGETSATIEWSPSLFALPGEVEYLIELSKDGTNFSNVEISETTTLAPLTVLDTDIDIRVDYFVRVKALGKDGMNDSNWLVSEPFRITGEIFIQPIEESDVLVDVAKIKWEPIDVLTKIVITPQGGTPFEIAISESEAAAGEKTLQGLIQNTNYTAEIFKGDVSKGSVTFTTKPSYADSNVIDLRNITDKPDILADTLSDIPSGSVVLLKRGQSYTIPSTKNLDRSVTITSGPDFIAAFATVFMSSNFNLVAGSVIDSLVFKDLYMHTDNYAGKYIFNINQVGTIGTVRFENVKGHEFRGFFRLQTGDAGTQVQNFLMNNCVVDSLRDFSLVNTNNSNRVANIKVTNTTLYDARKVIDHRSPGSNSIVFENCTFNNLPTGGAAGAGSFYFIDLNTENSANPIRITNCIFGKSRDENMGGSDVNGIRAGANTSVLVANSYKTSDFISTNVAYQIPGLLEYPGAATSIFANPSAGDYTIIDTGFPGANNTGDPRWRQ